MPVGIVQEGLRLCVIHKFDAIYLLRHRRGEAGHGL
jgi:hypothetical protein